MTESAPVVVLVVVTPQEVWDSFTAWAAERGMLVKRIESQPFYALLGLPVYGVVPGLEFRPEDMQLDIFRTGMDEPIAVRVVHKPTGLCVQRSGKGEVALIQDATAELVRLVAAQAGPTVAP